MLTLVSGIVFKYNETQLPELIKLALPGMHQLRSINTLVVQSLSCGQLFATHGLQHARLPSPSLSPRVCSNSCPLSQCCHPTISLSVMPFSSCPQSFPSNLSQLTFPVSQLFVSGGQSIGASALASVLPVDIQG